MGTSISGRHPRRRTPQRAVPQGVRRSGKPLFFGWGAHLTHHEREQVKERIAAGIGIIIALAVVVILAGGAVYDNIIRPAQQAAVNNSAYAYVGGVKITRGWYTKTLKAEQSLINSQIASAQTQGATGQALVQQLQQQLQQQPQQIYDQLIGDLVIEQRGARAGVRITAASDSAYLASVIKKQFFGKASNLAAQAKTLGLSSNEFNQFVLMQHHYQLLINALSKHVPKTGPAADVRHILITVGQAPLKTSYPKASAFKKALSAYRKQVTAAHVKAGDILRQLRQGGSWKVLARKFSGDNSVKPGKGVLPSQLSSAFKGGDLGLAQTSGYVPSFKKAANTWRVGKIGIIRSRFGFHVLEVLKRTTQKLTANQIAQNQQLALQSWLTKQEAFKGYVKRLYTPASASPIPGVPGLGR